MSTALLFDTDIGTDDTIAYLLWGLFPNLQPDFILCTPGNTTPEHLRITSRILKRMSGVKSSLILNDRPVLLSEPEAEANSFHGSDGFANLSVPASIQLSLSPEVPGDFLHWEEMERRLACYDSIRYISVGPLSTLFRFLENDALRRKLTSVYVMGGGFAHFNFLHQTEFNFAKFPEGVHRLLHSSLPLTLFPLDLTNRQYLTERQIDALSAHHPDPLLSHLLTYNMASNRHFDRIDGAVLHDTMPVLYTLFPEKFRLSRRRVDCDAYGRTFFSDAGEEISIAEDVEEGLLYGMVERLFLKHSS